MRSMTAECEDCQDPVIHVGKCFNYLAYLLHLDYLYDVHYEKC